MSVNRVTILGRLGAEPEIKRTQSGKLFASFRLACEERWRDKQSGQLEKRTEWVPVVVWTEFLAERVEEHAHKGMMIFVEGKYQTREGTDQSGNKRYYTEVIVNGVGTTVEIPGATRSEGSRDRGGDRDDRGSRRSDEGSGGRSSGGGTRGPRSMADDLDSEIPFAPEFR